MAQPLSNLAVGSKVKFGKHQVNLETLEAIIWKIVAKNHAGYPANSVTLHTEKIINLLCFDAREPSGVNSNRRTYGNNRYSVSNIDQWLNKDSGAGAWYTDQHAYDRIPDDTVSNFTQYATRAGFLNLFSLEERNAILTTTMRVAKNTSDGGGYEDIARKVFMPSATEVSVETGTGISEGVAFECYPDSASRIAFLTAQAFNNTLSRSKPSAIGNAWKWWLRTPRSELSRNYMPIYIDAYGRDSYVQANNGDVGIRPVCNLPSTVFASDTTDLDGCYTLTFWTPPAISPMISGVRKTYSDGAVRIGGVYRNIDEVHTKINGVWRKS